MTRCLISLQLQKLHRPCRVVTRPIWNVSKIWIVCVPDPITYSYKQLANHSPDIYEPGATQGNPVTCVLQIAPDHFKYFLDNDSAEIPIPSNQNCPLRELHRVAHVELGPLA